MNDTLNKLYDLVNSRHDADPKKSYVAKLFKKGEGKICQKIGEEAAEVIVAALDEKKKHVVSESADLLFHLTVLWAKKGIKPEDVAEELNARMGISGLDEKAARRDAARDEH